MRTNATFHKEEKWLEWVWRGSPSMGTRADIFSGELTTGQYGMPVGMPSFDSNGPQVQDDPRRHDYNLDEWVGKFITAATNLQKDTRTNHQM